MASYKGFNFLPPFNQAYPDNGNYPTDAAISGISRLDGELPQYNLTYGNLTSLQTTSGGVPTNLTGSTGPAGSTGGNSNYNPPATPFMMVTYGQTTQGIIQFVLVKGEALPQAPINTISYLDIIPDPSQYYFINANDILDMGRVVSVFYTSSVNYVTVNGSSQRQVWIKFYDAELIQQNPGNDISNYELYAYTGGEWTDATNSYAAWPSKFYDDSSTSTYLTELTFVFNEFLPSSTYIYNPNETQLKSGKFYHPWKINLNYTNPANNNGYLTYDSDNYYTGYGPGYPVNVNFGYIPLNTGQIPIIENGSDTIVNDNLKRWPGIVSLNVYSGKIAETFGYNTNYFGEGSDYTPDVGNGTLTINIDRITDNPFITCSCNNNNTCSSSSSSYFANNCSSVQVGIANYLTYQFIPFTQLKVPYGNLITGVTGTSYQNFTTYPQGITPSPTGLKYVPGPYGPNGSTGVTGVYFGETPIEIQNLIDGGTGATGYTPAGSSIISGWMTNSTAPQYNCDREVSASSYCGFIDYYESLAGLTYEYGLCGNTGYTSNVSQTAFQVGGCTGTQLCVPNFTYFSSYDEVANPPFICVDNTVGITTANLQAYINSAPPNLNENINFSIPRYAPVQYIPASVPSGSDPAPTKTTKSIFIYIAIAILVIIVIVIIVIAIKNRSANVKEKSIYQKYTEL